MADDWQKQLAKFGGIKLQDEKDPPKKNFPNKNQKPKNHTQNFKPKSNFESKTFAEKATAPYNFVALPPQSLNSEIENVDDFKNHIKNCEKISGEIQLEIETLTPIFLGGMAEKSFSPADRFIISGSSLRGMFKNIFKVVTCGAFRGRTESQKKGEDFNDEHIYYRCLMGVGALAWTKALNNLYKLRMEGEKGKNARPGFLIQTTDNKYFIAPSIYEHDRKEDRIFIKEYEKKFNKRIALRNSSCVEWHGRDAYIITGSNKFLHDEKSYSKLTDDQKKKAGKQFIRFTSIDYVDWSKRIELPDDVRQSYEHDRNRRGVNLFTDKGILKRPQLEKLCKNLPADVKTLIPCHFLYENEKVTAFGHGQCFRIPYKNSIGDLLPESYSYEKIVDFADAVFGYEKHWASRVFFEDATPISEIETLEKAAAHPLMQPNPTSYQLYLEQKYKNLMLWDDKGAQIRGYKFYWHNGKCDWKANDSEKQLDAGKTADKRLTKDLTPLKVGSKFKTKIRFQNLSAVELGALLMIFDLNGAKNAAYKIGMGKPLGFGSIKVTPKLFVESADAYTEIFDSSGWKNPYSAGDSKKYLDAFKKYIGDKKMMQAWEKVMGELQKILDWENKPAPEKIKSMSGDVSGGSVDERFRQRAPLPTIFEVVK